MSTQPSRSDLRIESTRDVDRIRRNLRIVSDALLYGGDDLELTKLAAALHEMRIGTDMMIEALASKEDPKPKGPASE